ncbi:UDP-N-acetylmuramate dehydrogenase [Pseudoxanthomonas koreensis]|uniref:UDP-N-acetylmuramate dehydrogenase n=1 Tax=Pseudoxanthomonas koreensis TaxID=266061 RepID=UPI0035A64A77
MSALFHLQRDADLSARNTFRVAARAPWLLRVNQATALPEALALEQVRGQPLLVLGGGSNLLFAGDAPGVVMELGAARIGIAEDRGASVRVRAEAGAAWHELVMWSLGQGLCGLENLALIPGSVGAAPIQNIGAYGVEAGMHIVAVDAWDRQQARWLRLDRDACAFGYRDSVFKQHPGRWIITALELELAREERAAPALQLGYAGVEAELAAMGVTSPRARDVAAAIIRVRQRKLPDPLVTGNAGSFFKNPLVPAPQAAALQAAHPQLPVFPGTTADTRKLPAAWLIEACGVKGMREGDAGISAAHALVLVNHGTASGAQLLALARQVAATVQARFDVALEPEPGIIGAQW